MKSQISLSVIIGLILLIIFISFAYLNLSKNRDVLSETKPETINNEAEKIKSYLQSCLFDLGVEGIYKILPNGGYVNPEQYIEFMGYKVAYWAVEGKDTSPLISDIEKEISSYIQTGIIYCMKEIKGIETSSEIDFLGTPEISVASGQDDVSIVLKLPMKITHGGSTREISEVSATLPYNINTNFQLAKLILNETLDAQPRYYDIKSNCYRYKTNQRTNIYTTTPVASLGNRTHIVKILDYEPLLENKNPTLRLHFAFQNTDIMGYCAV